MSFSNLVDALRLERDLVTALVDDLDDQASRTPYHPDLSPLGWHLGHCSWTESFWLQERILGDNRFTDPFRPLYKPSGTPVAERGNRLPELDTLLQWCAGLQSLNDDLLESATPRLLEHTLMQDHYLLHFLIQHYSRHYEAMLMVLSQRTIQADDGDFHNAAPLSPRTPETAAVAIQPGHYRVGGTSAAAYDNELPLQQVTLGPCSIAPRAISNSEYLAFMQDGGYRRRELWSDDGWQWQQQHNHAHPAHWRRNAAADWYAIAARGAYALDNNDPVSGLSYYEAEACAEWAGGRLPHEHQWEVACRLRILEDSGRAWEWCGNHFYPYAGYQPFPDEENSQTCFDERHFVLRGGSLHTRPSRKRTSLRNYSLPDNRHMFAGVRPVYDTSE